jgi:DNA-binding FadR family transcriptional regulator
MAATIQDSILSGDLEPGVALPTEPELAEQFGVSRAVVRDATRIVMAQGLVEVQQGRGVFVTPSQTEAFGEALLLALRRAGATVWDVEQFEQVVFPEVVALAATTATDQELAEIQRLVDAYLEIFARYQAEWWEKESPPSEAERLRASFRAIMQAIFDATHNQVFHQLALPLLKLRNLRQWVSEGGAAPIVEETPGTVLKIEAAYLQQLMEAIASRDADQARATIRSLMKLPPQAIEAMRRTPIGERPVLPIHPSQSRRMVEILFQGDD